MPPTATSASAPMTETTSLPRRVSAKVVILLDDVVNGSSRMWERIPERESRDRW